MFGWSKKKVVVKVKPEPLPEVTVKEVRETCTPDMKRRYHAPLSNDRWMEVEFKTHWRGSKRNATGYLYQSPTQYVFFDIDRLADQVIDATLVAEIRKYCDEMERMDLEWWVNDPSEYIDNNGEKWQRVEKT